LSEKEETKKGSCAENVEERERPWPKRLRLTQYICATSRTVEGKREEGNPTSAGNKRERKKKANLAGKRWELPADGQKRGKLGEEKKQSE